MYYQVVRIEDQGPDRDIFDQLDKWIRRGWTRKALAYMANWDYGEETADAAKHLGHVWRTATDERERTDYVIREENGYALCGCNGARNGGYYAYYLVSKLPDEWNLPEDFNCGREVEPTLDNFRTALRRCAEAHRVSCDLSRSILKIRSTSTPVAKDVIAITEAFYGEKILFLSVDRYFDLISIDYGLGHMLPKVDMRKLSLSLPFGTTI